ncbi:MAG: helix-turn-helix domain-containing protein [Halioglobus sp.]
MNVSELLTRHGLSKEIIRNDTGMLTAKQVHRLLADITDASGDPNLCWQTGWELDHSKYPMYAALLSRGHSLADIFTSLAVLTEDLASASRFELQIQGTWARFSGFRRYRLASSPHSDAFSVAALASLIKRFVKGAWQPNQVSIEMADLSLVPANSGCRLIQTQQPKECTIRFPALWLLPHIKGRAKETTASADYESAERLKEFLAIALQEHISDQSLNSETAARQVDCTLRDINHGLKPLKTTLAKLINEWRNADACRKLRHSDLSIADVGIAVGYPDATSFSRVFKRWTGKSPKDYRAAPDT